MLLGKLLEGTYGAIVVQQVDESGYDRMLFATVAFFVGDERPRRHGVRH